MLKKSKMEVEAMTMGVRIETPPNKLVGDYAKNLVC